MTLGHVTEVPISTANVISFEIEEPVLSNNKTKGTGEQALINMNSRLNVSKDKVTTKKLFSGVVL